MLQHLVIGDLAVVGSLEGGGGLGAVDLICVPEPTSFVMLVISLAALGGFCRRR
jgi:hypothetical protein